MVLTRKLTHQQTNTDLFIKLIDLLFAFSDKTGME
jgi:hypothetical protein